MVGLGHDENVAVGQEERIRPNEVLGELGCFSSAVLHNLTRVFDACIPTGAITKIGFDDVRAPPGNDTHVANAGLKQPVEDVF